jgi:hypothetical protein
MADGKLGAGQPGSTLSCGSAASAPSSSVACDVTGATYAALLPDTPTSGAPSEVTLAPPVGRRRIVLERPSAVLDSKKTLAAPLIMFGQASAPKRAKPINCGPPTNPAVDRNGPKSNDMPPATAKSNICRLAPSP